MKLHWLAPCDEKWRQHLSSVSHDVYHRPEYVRGEADMLSGVPAAILVEEPHRSFFLPLVLRTIPNSRLWDATSPKGYPGPLISLADDSPFERARFTSDAVKAVVNELQRRQVVAAFVRCHPFLTDGAAGMRIHGTVVDQGSTVYIDLEQSDEQLWRQTRSSHRSEINRCKKNGFESVIDLDWNNLDDFVTMYYQTMRRVGARDEHFFPRHYFTALRDQLAEHAFLCIAMQHGTPASGGIFTKCDNIVQYHLGATADTYVRQHPSKLLLDSTRRWAKQNGYKKMHLGGGVDCRPDALLNFKLGFSKLRTSFSTYRLITEPTAYQKLIQAWESDHGSTADGIDGYFPAYRKPTAAIANPNGATDKMGTPAVVRERTSATG